ncbi:MAG: metallophosphoesterase [Myxococcales bacterium]
MSPHLRMILLFVVLAWILAALGRHLHRRIREAFHPPAWVSRLVAIAFGAGIVMTMVSRFLSGAPELARPMGSAGGAIVLGILISSVLLLPYETFVMIAGVVQRRLAGRGAEPAQVQASAQPPDLTPPSRVPATSARRDFLKQAAVGSATSVGMGAALYGALIGRHDFTLETVPVRLAKLPRSLDGLSIVQLSDIHVGLFVGDPEFRRALELVQQAKPDIIVLTGDLLDHDARFAPVLGRFVRALRDRAPRGLFAIPGNHDYYAGVEPVEAALRGAGAEVLKNRHVVWGDAGGRLVLAGLDDVMAPDFGGAGPRLDQAFHGAPPDLARVLLSHNPSYFQESHGAADLTLSGHTHGGQITLFINPAQLVLRHGYVRGHYSHGESQLYVNRGFGTAGPPARVGSAPEVTKIVLTSS